MIHAASRRLNGAAFLPCLVLIVAGICGPHSASAANHPSSRVETTGRSALAGQLAAQVREIADSSSLSRTKKEKRISNLVRMTVVAATAYKSDPDEILGIALDLTAVAGRAAPHFAEIIASAVSFAAPITKIDGASGQIRTAAFAATKAPRPARRHTVPAPEAPEPGPSEAIDPPAVARAQRPKPVARKRPPVPEPESVVESDSDSVAALPTRRDPSMAPSAISLGDNITADVTLDLGIRRDNNIFSQPSKTTANGPDKTADTITSVTPGASVQFGQHSLAHGSLAYRRAFTRYQNNTAPAVALSSGSGSLGYDNGSFALNGGAALEQSNRSSNELLASGQKEIIRQDSSSGNLGAEAHITGKTSVALAGNYSRVEYKVAGLTGTKTVAWPLKVFYQVTPKLDISTGYTATQVTPDLDGPSSKDGYTNVGFRGSLTPKLTGNFSMGYRTRAVEGTTAVPAPAKEKLWGFDGGFNYDMTPKTAMSLTLSRDFNTGTLGESLKSSAYALKLTSDPTQQWQTSLGFNYHTSDFGAQVFRIGTPTTTSTDRHDSVWSGGFSTTYLFNSWLSATADYTFTNSHSTNANATFTDNIFGLQLGLRY